MYSKFELIEINLRLKIITAERVHVVLTSTRAAFLAEVNYADC